MAGRKPIPTNLKLLRGNPGKRALNKGEPKPKSFQEVPEPFEFLDERAVKRWRDIAPELMGQGLLTVLDLSAFASYCVAFALYAEVTAARKGKPLTVKSGHGLYGNPLLKIQDMAFKQLKAAEAAFGMDPSSRGRIKVADAPKEADPYEKWANKHGK